jgi:hypothetical protein
MLIGLDFIFTVVSLGLLHWIELVIRDPQFFLTFNASSVPPHLTLFDEVRFVINVGTFLFVQIARMHHLLRPHVLTSLSHLIDFPFLMEPQQLVTA